MQYLISVIDDIAGLPAPDEMAAAGNPQPDFRTLDAFNDRLVAEGHWVFGGGLAAPGTATVIDNRGGEALFTDGPFVESKEYLGGLWISRLPTSTWPLSSPPRGRGPATGRSRCGRSRDRGDVQDAISRADPE